LLPATSFSLLLTLPLLLIFSHTLELIFDTLRCHPYCLPRRFLRHADAMMTLAASFTRDYACCRCLIRTRTPR